MQDFFCTDPSKMNYPELAKRADFFKYENKGVNAMCEIMEKLQDEGRAEGRAEGRTERNNEMALKMLHYNEPIEKIMEYTSLSAERIQELAQQIR